ncbi:MAG: hypothetical protein ACFBZ9_04965 [Sphingomonadales bacterium]
MSHTYVRNPRQILSQQDLKDRGVRFYYASDGTAFGVIDAPLSASDQQQMTAFMRANNVLSYAVLLAEDTLARNLEKQGVEEHA